MNGKRMKKSPNTDDLSLRSAKELAERQNCRLLLVGDVKQHHSVEAGDALRALQKYAGAETVRLKEIHRQKSEEHRKVVSLLAGGKTHAAFSRLDRLGGVREQKDWNKLVEAAATTYVEKTQDGKSCLAISPVWSEVNNQPRSRARLCTIRIHLFVELPARG